MDSFSTFQLHPISKAMAFFMVKGGNTMFFCELEESMDSFILHITVQVEQANAFSMTEIKNSCWQKATMTKMRKWKEIF